MCTNSNTNISCIKNFGSQYHVCVWVRVGVCLCVVCVWVCLSEGLRAVYVCVTMRV